MTNRSTNRSRYAPDVTQPLPGDLRLALAHLEAWHLAQVALLALTLLVARPGATLLRWRARSRQRAQLAELSEHLLRDIGLDPAGRRRELRKWFWQA